MAKNHLIFTVIIIISLLALGFTKPKSYLSLIFVSIIFNIIALGNNFFGLLKNKSLKFLGEISYSTYLLHGIILFTAVEFILGIDRVKTFSSTQYCLFIFALSPIVVIISSLAYYYIERPFMNLGKKIK